MKRDLAALAHHFLVGAVVLIIEFLLKALVRLGKTWGLLSPDTADAVNTVMSYFMIFVIVILSVVTAFILLANGLRAVRGAYAPPPPEAPDANVPVGEHED